MAGRELTPDERKRLDKAAGVRFHDFHEDEAGWLLEICTNWIDTGCCATSADEVAREAAAREDAVREAAKLAGTDPNQAVAREAARKTANRVMREALLEERQRNPEFTHPILEAYDAWQAICTKYVDPRPKYGSGDPRALCVFVEAVMEAWHRNGGRGTGSYASNNTHDGPIIRLVQELWKLAEAPKERCRTPRALHDTILFVRQYLDPKPPKPPKRKPPKRPKR